MSFSRSFTECVSRSKGEWLYLSRGVDRGRVAWFYVLVEKIKLPLFLAAYKEQGEPINLLHYGKIIASGWGENPPEAIKEQILAQVE